MSKTNKKQGKQVVGLFADGLNLQVVRLIKQNKKIQILDADTVSLITPLDPPPGTSAIFNHAKKSTSEKKRNAGDAEIRVIDSSEVSLKPLKKNAAGETQNVEISHANEMIHGKADSSNGESSESELLDIIFEFHNLKKNEPESSENPVHSIETKPVKASDAQNSELIFEDPELIMENDISEKTEPMDLSQEIEDEEYIELGENSQEVDNASVLLEILNRYSNESIELAISLSEPNVYYSYFENDWGLKGRKLKQKIISELTKEKIKDEAIKPESVNVIRLAGNSLLTVTKDSDNGIINLLEQVRNRYAKRLPKISVVECAEISLVNLVKQNYKFKDSEKNVIIYVGHEFSRLIFMKGNELYHISSIIGEGTDSYIEFGYSLSGLANTVRNRLMLEQDNLNFKKLDNIILTGEANIAGVKEILSEWLSDGVDIHELKFSNFGLQSLNLKTARNLPHIAVAIGAASKVLEGSNSNLYGIDLTPFQIKESQKVFKLGFIGWLLLVLIPVLTFYMTIRIETMRRNVTGLKVEQQQKKSELGRLMDIETRVKAAKSKLSYYQNTFGVLDSMIVGTQTWGKIFRTAALNAYEIGSLWITEMNTVSKNKLNVKGYSVFRNRIPRFSDSLGNSTLKKVLVQEIRGRAVNNFEVEIDVTHNKRLNE